MYSNIYNILKAGGKVFTSCFGTKTDGYNTGQCLEKNTFINIEKGALQGRGRAHFYTKRELMKILEDSGFKNIIIDTMLYTDKGATVEMFTAQGEK